MKAAIHRRLIQRLNLDRVTQLNRDAVRAEVVQIVENLTAAESTPMTLQEKERLAQEILDEVFGLGPLEPLLKDSIDFGYPGQYLQRCLRRAQGIAGADQRAVS